MKNVFEIGPFILFQGNLNDGDTHTDGLLVLISLNQLLLILQAIYTFSQN
jgi:hypothetical protein